MEGIEIRLAYDVLEDIRDIFQEYTESLQVNLDFQQYEDELQGLDKKYAMPQGRIYAAYVQEKLAGCLAFHALSEQACEFKRLYVKPSFRGQKIARQLMDRAICDARKIGYRHVYLDTLASLKPAMDLYEKIGFAQIPPYYANPLPDVRYYKLNL